MVIFENERKTITELIVISAIILVLLSPPLQGLVRQQSAFYEAGTLVITKPLTMNIESGDDIFYGQNTFLAVLVFYNIRATNYSFESFIQTEFSKADINITFVRVWLNETPRVYKDYEFESKMNEIKTEYHADFISVFANMRPNEDQYPRLIGYADIKVHFSIVFCPKLPDYIDWSAVQTHEIGHLMGLQHVNNPSCLMYHEYLYTNRHFCEGSIELLYTYHH